MIAGQDDLIPLRNVVVNYAYLGMDEGYPAEEAVGTLIQAMAPCQYLIKLSATHVRPATPEEVSTWPGPTSPSWWKPPR